MKSLLDVSLRQCSLNMGLVGQLFCLFIVQCYQMDTVKAQAEAFVEVIEIKTEGKSQDPADDPLRDVADQPAHWKSLLNEWDLGQFAPEFKENGWTDSSLWNQIYDTDLKSMGLKKGHRTRFRAEVYALDSAEMWNSFYRFIGWVVLIAVLIAVIGVCIRMVAVFADRELSKSPNDRI